MDLQRHLVGLSLEELRAYISDLWAARGYESIEKGSQVVAIDPSNQSRTTIQVVTGESEQLPSRDNNSQIIDILVSACASADLRDYADQVNARYCGPEELHSMLLYAIDRETAADLAQDHFGVSLNDEARLLEPTSSKVPSDSNGTTRKGKSTINAVSSRLRTNRRLLGTSFVILLLLVAVALSISHNLATARSGPETSTGLSAGPTETTEQYPPGVNGHGITNLTQLVLKHRQSVHNRSYRLVIRHNGSRGSYLTKGRWIFSRQVVRVGSNGSHIRVNGTLPPTTVGESPRQVSVLEYRNQSICERRISPVTESELNLSDQCAVLNDPSVRERLAGLTGKYLLRYTKTSTTFVQPLEINQTARYRIWVLEPPSAVKGEISGYTAVLDVGPSGMVWLLKVEYTWHRFDGPRQVRFKFRYTEQAG